MGNTNKKPQDYEVVRTFNPSQWQNRQKRPNFQIWQSPTRNLRADVYPIKSDIKPADLDHYEMRYNNSQDIVKVHNINLREDSSLCARSSNAHVFVERVPYRLGDVGELSQADALGVLRSAYSGFNTLSTFYGPVQPYEDLICFNEEGKTKVWVNSNLASNGVAKATKESVSNLPNVNAGYVNKILDMVENKTAGGSLPPRLKNKFREAAPKSYFQALNLIQEYATQQQIQIPSVVHPRLYNSFDNGAQIHTQSQVQMQNGTISKVQSYNPGVPQQLVQSHVQTHTHAPTPIHTHTSSQLRQTVSYLPNQSSQFLVGASQGSLRASLPVNQRQEVYNSVQTTQYNNIPSSSISFRANPPQGSVFRDNRASNYSISGVPTSPRIVYGQTLPVGTVSPPKNVFMQTPGMRFESPSKVATHQAVRQQQQVSTFQEVRPETAIKSLTQSPQKTSQPKISQTNINEASKLSQVSEKKEIQPPQQQQQPPPQPPQPPQTQSQPQLQPQIQPQIQPVLNRGPQIIPTSPQQFNQANNINYFPRPGLIPVNHPQNFVSQNQRILLFPAPHISGIRPQIGQQIRKTPIFFQGQQILINQQQQQTQPQPQPQSQPQPQLQLQPQLQPQIQPQIQPQPQVQQQQQSSAQETKQIQQETQKLEQKQVQQQEQHLSNEEQNLAEAYSDYEQEQGYEEEGNQQEQIEKHLEQLHEERLFGSNVQESGNKQQTVEVIEEKAKLQEQKQQSQSKQSQQINYFPFSGQASQQQFGEIKRVATMQIKQIQQPTQSQAQPKKQQPIIQQQAQKSQQQSPVRIKQQPQQRPQPQPQQMQTIKQSISQQNNNTSLEYTYENVHRSYDPSSSYQYQYQYKSAIPQKGQQDRIPDDARYEDIEQYIRNKYQTYIGVGASGAGGESSSYRPSSEVSPYTVETKKVEQGEMYSYVESKYDQFANQNQNQDIQFSFRPTQAEVKRKEQKPSLVSSYEYMRVQQMYGGESEPAIEQAKPVERKSILVAENKRGQKGQNDDDLLDVKNMERSLDKKYSSMKSNQQIKDLDSAKRDDKEENQLFDVKKLQQNLIRFEESRVGSRQVNPASNISEPRFETSQVSKINSIDEKIANRRSSMNRDFGYKDQITSKDYSYENQSPVYELGRKSRTSKVTKQISDIEQKFNKYVKLGAGGGPSVSSKTILKPKEDNNGYRDYDYDSSSRMATGHFGYADTKADDKPYKSKTNYNYEQKTTFITSEVRSPKNLSYEDLRKFMWS